MGARRYLRLTPETTWGTFNALGTGLIVDLDTANSYTVRPKPVAVDVRSAGGRNRRIKKVSKKTALAGNLNMLLPGSHATAIAAWICAAEGTDALGSMTIDYCVQMEDTGNTLVYSRHLGMMVQQATINSSEQAQLTRLALQLVGQQSATIDVDDFPEPLATAYPTDAYFTHEDLSGGVSISTSRTEFETFNVTIKNMLDVKFFESRYPTRIKFCGRDVDWTSKLAYKIVTDRSNYESNTPVAASAAFDNGSKTMTLSFKGKNHYDNVEDDLDDSKVWLQELSMQSFWDTTATANDFAITVTDSV